jgi:tetratricopeptide (TPR) repeat protein
LLIAVLLERGAPVTLQEAAARFEEAGIGSAESVLASLKRCRPARAPIYRDGDHYALDPHDAEADLWAFRLGLKRPKVASLRVVRPEVEQRPPQSPEKPLSVADLEEAWTQGIPGDMSAQRLALCVLDAHQRPMQPQDVVAFVAHRAQGYATGLSADSAQYWRSGAVRVTEDGRWDTDPAHDALVPARRAIAKQIEMLRRRERPQLDPAVVAASIKQREKRRAEHHQTLAKMRRVLIHAFPEKKPKAVVLIDIATRDLRTWVGEEMSEVHAQLVEYDMIVGLDVRALLRTLGFDPGARRLGELGPAQKSRTLNKRGRKLKITTTLLIQSSCGIRRPFGDNQKLQAYIRDGALGKLRRRLEANAKSLFALYQYGRLHGAVRLRWGFLDERIAAPWVHRDERILDDLKKQALERDVPLEVVVGTAPGWEDPWSRMRRLYVRKEENWWNSWLIDEDGFVVDEAELQLARLPQPEAWHPGLRSLEEVGGEVAQATIRSAEPAEPAEQHGGTDDAVLIALPIPHRMKDSVTSGGQSERQDAALREAQNLMYEAWDARSPQQRTALARQALEISADCADAYNLLAEQATTNLEHARALYHQGVQAGERALGLGAFENDVGHFWGLLETRPYMRALWGRARCSWELGQRQDAVAHAQELLRLNPNDNQAVRHVLAAWLLELDRVDEVKTLLNQYEEDGFVSFPYARALLAFREKGDTPKARALLAEALSINPHVPGFLLGHKKMPPVTPDDHGFGDEQEAIAFCADYASAWTRTPGAIEWLRTRCV